MCGRNHLYLGCLVLLFMCLYSNQTEIADNVLIETHFVQKLSPTEEYSFRFDNDEIFNVDLNEKKVRWKLAQFGEVASFDAAQALQSMKIDEYNFKILIERSNSTKTKNVAPELNVFSENPVVVGEPNVLICWANKFFPPSIKMTWMKNGQPVTHGASETDFYGASDGSYSKFLYLAIIPREEEMYTCSVEHAGQTTNPTNRLWSPEVPKHVPETYENVVCGLGLAFGICGIIAGIVLIVKGMKNMTRGREH
ncbi:RLA class II histocompatibility antigen, DP alpha-1 chain-like [Pyxicephalus adspersus]|uniref:Ig-like domain-containing protein n=1 Tax=Pyxicephalus adspersus TaxID=30357 RepID=A0AAV3A850_PYXAD|nr:TPA: hypothetical protein GDO54_017239 [Pyxicephalus adspersus]